jgi:hypothetical protein
MEVIEFGTTVTGQFAKIESDEFGDRIFLRVSAPTERRPQGYETRIDYTPFNPQTGQRTLPPLRAGDVLRVTVKVNTRTYKSTDQGRQGLSTYELLAIEVLDGVGDEAMKALDSLGQMSNGASEAA